MQEAAPPQDDEHPREHGRALGIASLACAAAAPCFGPLLLVAPVLAVRALRAGRRVRGVGGYDPARLPALGALALVGAQGVAYTVWLWVLVEILVV